MCHRVSSVVFWIDIKDVVQEKGQGEDGICTTYALDGWLLILKALRKQITIAPNAQNPACIADYSLKYSNVPYKSCSIIPNSRRVATADQALPLICTFLWLLGWYPCPVQLRVLTNWKVVGAWYCTKSSMNNGTRGSNLQFWTKL